MAVFVQGFVDCTHTVNICKDDIQKFYIIDTNIGNIHVNSSVLEAVEEEIRCTTDFF